MMSRGATWCCSKRQPIKRVRGSRRPSNRSAMPNCSQIRLVLFLTRATPLATWHKVGIIEREAALYRRLRPRSGGLQIVTSGGPEEVQYQDYLGDVEILYNRHGRSPNVYSLVAPLIHREALAAATIYKTNQLDGAWTAIL